MKSPSPFSLLGVSPDNQDAIANFKKWRERIHALTSLRNSTRGFAINEAIATISYTLCTVSTTEAPGKGPAPLLKGAPYFTIAPCRARPFEKPSHAKLPFYRRMFDKILPKTPSIMTNQVGFVGDSGRCTTQNSPGRPLPCFRSGSSSPGARRRWMTIGDWQIECSEIWFFFESLVFGSWSQCARWESMSIASMDGDG